MTQNEQVIDINDLVAYYGEDGGYRSAGYLISSVFNGGKLPPIVTINGQPVKGAASLQTGGTTRKNKDDAAFDTLRGFAIPIGLATMSEDVVSSGDSNMEGGNVLKVNKNDEVISTSIYDRLLDLVKEHNKSGKSRRTRRKQQDKSTSKKHKKTRRN